MTLATWTTELRPIGESGVAAGHDDENDQTTFVHVAISSIQDFDRTVNRPVTFLTISVLQQRRNDLRHALAIEEHVDQTKTYSWTAEMGLARIEGLLRYCPVTMN